MAMTPDLWLGAAVAFLLLGYLIVVLARTERF